jgi:hypothetical protein
MRALLVVVLVSAVAAGCTPYIPAKDDFGTSAAVRSMGLQPAGVSGADIPPGFEVFNVYDPRVNALLAAQLCATPPQPVEATVLGASTGRIVQSRTRCQTHIPLFGP